MGKLSRIYCPSCGYNLRRLEKDSGKKKDCLYQCPFCHQNWLVTMGNSSACLHTFVKVKEEEIIVA